MASVEILQAVPAAGKTKALLGYVKKSGKPTLIASIGCQLNQQSFDWYQANGGRDAIILDTENVSDRTGVIGAIKAARENYRVLFITHQALLRYPDYNDFTGYELFIDEVPDIVTMNELKFTDNMGFITNHCNEDETGLLTIKHGHRGDLKRIARDGLNGNDVISASIHTLAIALLCDTPVRRKGGSIYFVDDNSVANWDAFSKITVACANFEETFTGVVLKYYNGWTFKGSPLVKDLDFTEYPNTERVEIIPLYGDNWSRYAADKETDGVSVYSRIKETVYELTGKLPFIYTTNSYRTPLQRGEAVTYNPHGLNSYMSHTTAVALFSFNPMPWQIQMLKNLSQSNQLDDEVLSTAFVVSKYLEPVFQLCTRTDIRNKNSRHKVTLIVPDMRAAEYLKHRYLKNATIDASYMLDADKPKQSRKTRWNQFAEMFQLTDKEKRSLNSWSERNFKPQNGRNLDPTIENDIIIVSGWVAKKRK